MRIAPQPFTQINFGYPEPTESENYKHLRCYLQVANDGYTGGIANVVLMLVWQRSVNSPEDKNRDHAQHWYNCAIEMVGDTAHDVGLAVGYIEQLAEILKVDGELDGLGPLDVAQLCSDAGIIVRGVDNARY